MLGYKQKLDSRNKKYMFVGYTPVGYRLWNENLRKVILSGDVIFKIPEVKPKDNRTQINMGSAEKDNTKTDNLYNNIRR